MKTLVKIFLGIIVLASLLGLAVHAYSSKAPKPTPHEKQLAYVKKHQQEIVNLVKQSNPKVESVQIDWDSMEVGSIGNGLPQGGGYNLSVSGTFNNLPNTIFAVDFYLEHKNDIPDIQEMGMLNSIYIYKNGFGDIFE